MSNKVYLFTGVETFNWSLDQFQKVIDLCKSVGVSGLIVKIYEIGTGEWYGHLGGSTKVAHLIASQGLQWIPYGFFYGNNQGVEDAAILKFLNLYDIIMLDMESSWNGSTKEHIDILKNALMGHKGEVWVSTWADPVTQNWISNIKELDSVVNVWMPMIYFPNLVQMFKDQFPKVKGRIEPTYQKGVNLSDFTNSNVSIWEYQSVDWNYLESVVDKVNPASDIVLPPLPSTDFSLQEMKDIWPTTIRSNTFIHQIWTDIRKRFFLGMPLSEEIATVDWNNNPVMYQAFSSNYHIEYNKTDKKCRVYDSNKNVVFES